ncbi:extracellular solute-binding protein [Microbacterium sp. Mu-80]|uniref:Extracellular solute-binding protein n=1 Tax=Microbacterium bandirmense TaxID=3122050 RepID=A0ABU8LAL3_9MICO
MVTKAMNWRTITAVGAASALTLSLAACGPSGGGGAEESGSKEITIGMNSGLVPAFEQYAADFTAEFPEYTVTVNAVPDAQPDYIQQLVTQGLSSTTPDIIFNYDTLNQTLANNKLLFDMGPWLEEGKDGLTADGFIPNFLDQYRVGDQITGMPVSADSGMLFYNEEVFKKYGVTELPTAEWTLEDMYRVAEEITDKAGGEAYGLGTPIGDSTGYFTFYPTIKAFGSNIYDPASEKFVFADKGGLEAWEVLLAPYLEEWGTPYATRQDGLKMFNSGQIAMIVNARPNVVTYRESLDGAWNVQQLPTVNGKSTTGGGSYSLSVSDKSSNKEGAWKFLSWFYSTDGGMKSAEPNGVVPATKDGLANGTWKEDTNPVPSNLIVVTEYAVENAILPDAIPDDVQPKVAPALTKALELVVLDGKSIEEAYTAAQDELNGLLK